MCGFFSYSLSDTNFSGFLYKSAKPVNTNVLRQWRQRARSLEFVTNIFNAAFGGSNADMRLGDMVGSHLTRPIPIVLAIVDNDSIPSLKVSSGSHELYSKEKK